MPCVQDAVSPVRASRRAGLGRRPSRPRSRGVGRGLVRSPKISRSRRAATAHNPYDGAPGWSEPYAVPGG